jgi:hypothetical protein
MFVFEFTFRYKQQRTVHVQARLSGQNQKSDGGQKKNQSHRTSQFFAERKVQIDSFTHHSGSHRQ